MSEHVMQCWSADNDGKCVCWVNGEFGLHWFTTEIKTKWAGCVLGCRCLCVWVRQWARWLSICAVQIPLTAGAEDSLLRQARTSARHLHVLSHASTQLDFTSASSVITQTVKNKPQTLRVCVCARESDSVRALTPFSCLWRFTICSGPSL